ncbi:MAG: FAD-dependent oxidoreductase [Eubacteriales bacterium]|nr:FAD-dependent oxidoreductase [Eubacteriales bacterium]
MKYDLMIIGAGPAGYTLAASAAAAGLSVLVFEKSKLGGTCLNRGCIPTKTYLAITDLLPSCKKFLDAGLKYEDLSFDLAALLKYKDDVVTRLQTQIEALFKAHKVEVIAAEAKLISGHEIEASGQVYKGERIVIAAGGKPTVPAVFAEAYKNSKRIVTSDELLDLEAGDYFKSEMKRVAIIGGGIIGVEFAQIFSNLGAEVSLFEAMPRLLMRMDSDISKTLERNFKLAKIKVEKNVQVLDLLDEGEEVQIHYQKQKANATVETKAFDLVLIAIGRRSEVESVLG